MFKSSTLNNKQKKIDVTKMNGLKEFFGPKGTESKRQEPKCPNIQIPCNQSPNVKFSRVQASRF